MSKLKDTLLMMAEQKENFKIGDKTFQIIEVKEAEQPQPDYSHLVGKWVKCIREGIDKIQDKYYQVVDVNKREIFIKDNTEVFNWQLDGTGLTIYFDITNPQDTNPDEVKKILVPKEIGIGITRGRDIMGIIFGMNQFLVSPYVYEYPYLIWGTDLCTPIQCELIKCERAELKKGDLAFRTQNEFSDFVSKEHYCVIIDDFKFCHVSSDCHVVVNDDDYKHWYKLQPIEQ